MKNSRVLKNILLYERVGFSLIIALLWLNEVLDIPHYVFGAPNTPVNWRESLVETVLVAALAILVTRFTRFTMARVSYLERFILVCASCRRVCFHQQWIPFDVFLRDHSDTHVSHGLCPSCAAEMSRGILTPSC